MAKDRSNGKPHRPQVSVLALAYESGPLLARCLAAIRAQSYTDYEIVLADNASADGAPQACAAADPAIRLIENGANLGFAGGINRAVEAARGTWIALINPDAFAEPDWLARLMQAAGEHPDIRCFASRQLMAENPDRLDGLGDVMTLAGFPYRGGYRNRDPGPLAPGEVFSACGGAMLIARELFLGMGGFDERLFCYCEDVDLGYRLRLAGERVLVIPDAVVRHVGSASTGGPRSDFAMFHGARNRLWVFLKNTPPVLFWLTLPLHAAVTAALFLRHWARGELAAPWRGLKAALGGLKETLSVRRETQAGRRCGSWTIARAMAWNPWALVSRPVVIRRARPSRPVGP